ncbi:hypothetical protein ACJMK2_032289 [Sinanodonta woodiana]|uniref:Uncharacterized protein n=1 Tax=Sinanodonta woodiana TaxID=1069815 RepID=A0ABD3X1V0_SINWO
MAEKEDGLSAYANGLPNEARSRYMQKLDSIKDYKGLLDLYNLKCGWMSDPSIWPDMTFGNISCYLHDASVLDITINCLTADIVAI